jgi:outer membrane protein OmpA-like peptidoglycan-associated protein
VKSVPISILLLIITIVTGIAQAGDLSFPTTEAEIIEALSLKDGKTVYEGTEFLSKKGKVYKIVGGIPFRVRGMGGIVDSNITPKAGAMVLFDLNKASIKHNSYDILDTFGRVLKSALSDATLIVAGHTDSSGSNTHNMQLSIDRAKSVKSYLVARHGIDTDNLKIKGYGETKPLQGANATRNRRVEFIRIQ